MVEVSTFRAPQHARRTIDRDEHGRLLSDNVFGTQAEDAARRDFTVNALYYDPVEGRGLGLRPRRRDLQREAAEADRRRRPRATARTRCACCARCASRPSSASRSTPRRAAPIPKLAHLIAERAAGAALRRDAEAAALGQRRRDACAACARTSSPRPAAAARRDPRAAARDRSFVEVALAQHRRAPARRASRCRPRSCSRRCCGTRCCSSGTPRRRGRAADARRCTRRWTSVLDAQAATLAIPRRFDATMKEIWSLQPRFEQRAGTAAVRLLEHPRFRAAYDFLALRAESARSAAARCRWWGRFQDADRPSARRCCGRTRRRRRSAVARPRPQEARGRRRRAAAAQPARRLMSGAGDDRARSSASAATSTTRPRRSRAPSRRSRACRDARSSRVSPNYATAPVGYVDAQPDFVNAVALLDTALAPRALLERLHAIERASRARARRTPTRRGRSISTSSSTAAARSTSRGSSCRIRGCTSARSCCAAGRARAGGRIPGGARAPALARAVRDQRIARTRTHQLH